MRRRRDERAYRWATTYCGSAFSERSPSRLSDERRRRRRLAAAQGEDPGQDAGAGAGAAPARRPGSPRPLWPGREPGLDPQQPPPGDLRGAAGARLGRAATAARCLELSDDLIVALPAGAGRGSTSSPSSGPRPPRARAAATPTPTAPRSTPTRASCCPRTATRSGPRRGATRCTSCAWRWGSSWPSWKRRTTRRRRSSRLREVLVEAPLHEPAHRALMRLYVERRAPAGGAGPVPGAETGAAARVRRRARRRDPPPLPGDPHPQPRGRGRAGRTRPRAEPVEPAGRAAAATAADQLHRPRARAERDRGAAARRAAADPDRAPAAAARRGWRWSWPSSGPGTSPTASGRSSWPPLGEPELIGPAIAQALGTRLASDRAPERRARRPHRRSPTSCSCSTTASTWSTPVAHLVEALLRRCPSLTVLATSREQLRVPGEVTWRVPSLVAAAAGRPARSRRGAGGRVGAALRGPRGPGRPGFELDDGNAVAVATLCYRLDGMPLAIELAAARVSMLTPAQIVERLDDSLDLLSAGSRTAMTRQQTLRATLAWSFDLLDADEQVAAAAPLGLRRQLRRRGGRRRLRRGSRRGAARWSTASAG